MDRDLERAQLRVGASLRGKYLLQRVLGVGAMAAVYEATHRNGTRVAVKVLHTEVAAIPDIKKRFQREGYIANRIEHPSVVRITDDDEDVDGTVFVVMELLQGHTLETELKTCGGRLPPSRVIAMGDAVLDALEVAHAAGVIHRDIKPDNVFLTLGGIKILDFGIARLMDISSVTKSGQMMGTPEFVAPEQAGGRIHEIDGRTDLFSVGAMMFTMLTGDFVQHARTPIEYMVFAATKPAPPIRSVMPELDRSLAEVIDVALAFEKEKRWASARQMQAALRGASFGLEETVATTGAYERLQAMRAGRERRTTDPMPPRANQQRLPEVSSTRTVPMMSPASEQPIPLKRK